MARGSIVQRGGSYRVMVSYFVNGKRRQVTKTAHTKREAEKVKTALLTHIDNGTLAEPKGTLEEFLNRWLEEYAVPNLSPTTSQGYKHVIFTHINTELGNVNLKNLRPEHLQKYYSIQLSKELSSTTVRHHAMILHRALEHAVKWGLLARNPADAVSPPKMRHAEMKILQQPDIEVVLAESQKTQYYALFFTALMTGMRRSELLGLRWSDVNLTLAELSVNRAMHRLQKHEVIYRTPKSEKSRRVIALSPATCKVLRDHWESQTALRKRFSMLVRDSDLVFSELDGRPYIPHTVSQAWRRIVRRLGLKGVRFHDLRHTCASMLLQQGVHPKIVQERLGHSSISITLDLYSHVVPGLQHAAADKMDAIFNKSVTNPLPNTLLLNKAK